MVHMRILAIETSCDETALSLLDASGGFGNPKFKILGNVVASQVDLHTKYGGVFPMMAKREHVKNIFPLFVEMLKSAKAFTPAKNPKPWSKKIVGIIEELLAREADLVDICLNQLPSIKKPNIDAIAVTYGPGLEPALWVGLNFAKVLSLVWDIPLVPVNHMEGHILSILLQKKGKSYTTPKLAFPSLALLISGGHTELVLVQNWMKYKMIGQTRDDAVGEAFDKVARMLELPYPGGPQISKLAEELRAGVKESANNFSGPRKQSPDHEKSLAHSFTFPRPMIHSKDFDFSFSGLKTSVLYLIRDLKKENEAMVKNGGFKKAVALEFENAVTEVLTHKTMNAMMKYKTKTLIVGGGVAANKHIREVLTTTAKTKIPKSVVYFPERDLATDNSLMIGIAGYFRFLKSKGKTKNPLKLRAEGNVAIG